MGSFFSSDGPIYQFLDKVGRLILLNLLWILCCLPVVTIVPATTAFYYTVIKSIRRGHGYPTKEFLHSLKSNLVRGIPLSILMIAMGALLLFNIRVTQDAGTKESLVFLLVYVILIFFCIGFAVWLCPVLSRFSIRMGRLLTMTSAMVFRHLPVTILLSAGSAGVVWIIQRAISIVEAEEEMFLVLAILLLLPGAWCYLSTYLVEPVLKKYMPKPEEGEKAWYYE
ncbi:MAG: YesL family protein [Lachnospiraceae bacterium]|nr:YesL family protein [Lachnospiraceae bacterium]